MKKQAEITFGNYIRNCQNIKWHILTGSNFFVHLSQTEQQTIRMRIHPKYDKNRTKAGLYSKKKKKSKWIMISITILTFFLCSLPDFHMEEYLGLEYTWWFDMIQHGGYYFVITIILSLILPQRKYSGLLQFYLYFGSFFFEIIQVWIPLRNFTFLDIISNFLGISLALLLLRLISHFNPRQGKKNFNVLID